MTARVVVLPEVRVQSSQGEVTRRIGVDIIAGCYPQGSALPRDAELTAAFAVSRTVLRESFKTLAAKGLLRSKAGDGTRVKDRSDWNMFDPDVLAWHLQAGIDWRFLCDLADIRLAVEPRAAALAAERRRDDAVAALRATMQRMREADSNTIEFVDADLRLHLAVATASANPFMRSVGSVVEAALRVSFRMSAPASAAERDRSITAHQRIVDAIVARRANAASDAMTEVIMTGMRSHAVAGNPARSQQGGRL